MPRTKDNNRATVNVFLFIAIFSLICFSACSNSHTTQIKSAQSVYDRVMKSGTIRCGYGIFPPYCMKDPNTGKLSGIFVDILNEAGKNLSLKIDWAEEVGWANIIQGLETDRYDVIPTGIWPNASRGKHGSFSIPLFYNVYKAYARQKDNRFDNDLQSINSESVIIATIDGYTVQYIAQKRFPRARMLTHPDMCDGGQVFLDIVSNKADVTFADPSLAKIFLQSHPDSIKEVGKKPISLQSNTMMFKIGETAFKSMLDTALTELINTGYVDTILNKYEPTPSVYLRVAKPYRTN